MDNADSQHVGFNQIENDNEMRAAECNFESSACYDDVDDEPFELTILDTTQMQTVSEDVPYCNRWIEKSGVKILQRGHVERSYNQKGIVGLFHLFLTKSFFDCVRQWTAPILGRRGQNKGNLPPDLFMAYVGLEIATSVQRLNSLREYWDRKMFLGSDSFIKVMSRNVFMNIRSALRFYPSYSHDMAVIDPLWHSRIMLSHFCKNAASLAVPTGVTSLDENTIRCKGRTGARSYMKSKPVKFGIRFYATVGWRHAYLHSLFDNGSGNKTGVAPAISYTSNFRALRGPFEKRIDENLVAKKSASALWALQMSHQTMVHPTPATGRLFVTDNFYTRHLLAEQVQLLTDGEVRVLGTVRFNNVDAANRPALKTALDKIKNRDRGSWLLCQAFTRSKNKTEAPKLSSRSGYILWKDRATVIFYSNDLACTPCDLVQEPNIHAIGCVHGLSEIQRWTGTETMHRTTFQVPSLIVAYNLFMNGVDRFDQFRSTNAIVRKERRVPMSVFTFLLDAALQNAYSIYKTLVPADAVIPLRAFKRCAAEALVTPFMEISEEKKSLRVLRDKENSQSIDVFSSFDTSRNHMLLENIGKKTAQCYLCKLLRENGTVGSSVYSCSTCKFGFHVNCFSFFHAGDSLKEENRTIYDLMQHAKKKALLPGRRARKNNCTSSLKVATMPFKK